MKKKNKSKVIKIVIKIVLIVVLSAIGLYYVLKDDPIGTFSVLSQADVGAVSVVVLMIIAMLMLDGLILTVLAKRHNKKYSYGQGMINAQIGNFIGSFSKASSNFVQAYTFTKQDIKGANAASILTMNFLVYQVVFVIFSTVMVFLGYNKMSTVSFGSIPMFVFTIIGFSISFLILSVILLLSLCKPIHRLFIDILVWFSVRFHLTDSEDECRKKWTLHFVTYRLEMMKLRKNKGILIFLILSHLAKQIILNTLPLVCLWALKVNVMEVSYPTMLSSSSYLQLISSYIPAGGAEIAYQETYQNFFKQAELSQISASNILWRMMTFYFNLIVGGLCFIFYKGVPKREIIRANTATIFDLEVINYAESADYKTQDFVFGLNSKKGEKKHHSKKILLTEEDVKKSFDRIKRYMQDVPVEETIVENQDSLEEQKKQLINVLKESEELMKQKEVSKEVIDITDKEIQLNKKKHDRRVEKKKRKMKDKALKLLEDLQVDGTTVSVDDKKGIDIKGPEIYETKTNITYDPDEKR